MKKKKPRVSRFFQEILAAWKRWMSSSGEGSEDGGVSHQRLSSVLCSEPDVPPWRRVCHFGLGSDRVSVRPGRTGIRVRRSPRVSVRGSSAGVFARNSPRLCAPLRRAAVRSAQTSVRLSIGASISVTHTHKRARYYSTPPTQCSATRACTLAVQVSHPLRV